MRFKSKNEKKTKTAAGAASAAAKKKATSNAQEYAKLMAEKDSSAARRYSPKGAFDAGEVLLHPKFGTGVIVAARGTNKLDVLFPEGEKVLIHRR